MRCENVGQDSLVICLEDCIVENLQMQIRSFPNRNNKVPFIQKLVLARFVRLVLPLVKPKESPGISINPTRSHSIWSRLMKVVKLSKYLLVVPESDSRINI